MPRQIHTSNAPCVRSLHFWAVALSSVLACAAILAPVRAQSPAQSPSPSDKPASSQIEPVSTEKPDAKKAKAAYQEGIRAERQKDWDAAYAAYSDAVDFAPTERQYLLRREIARSRLVQTKMDTAERDAISGRLDDARRELLGATYIDPSNTVVRERLAELAIAEPGRIQKIAAEDIGGEIHLAYQSGTHSFDYRGNTQGAYDEIGRQFGVEAAFDVDLPSRAIHLKVDAVDFQTATRLLGDMTGTFWRPLTRRLFFVAQDTPQKRKDYDASVVRTILLPASETTDQMTEILRMVREIAGITRSDLDAPDRVLTLRASPRAIAIATDLIDNLEQPTGEMVLEMEILDVDRTRATQLGITPPQTAQIYTFSSQQIQEAEQSQEGLLNVIEQVFGGTTLPPVVVFGGGLTTFVATLPGATADFAEMLSVVRDGRRVLLRAQDGQPATFFVGERIPVSLATFSPSLLSGTTGTATSLIDPITNYTVGNQPVSIVAADFHDTLITSSIDLAVANQTDNTISILQGNGDGTFETQTLVTLPTGFNPTSLATAQFTGSGHKDLVVSGTNPTSGAGSVAILLGNGDGTFNQATPSLIAVGNGPVFVVTNDFNGDGFQDIAVANKIDNTVSILLGTGMGTFTAPLITQLAAGFTPTSLATGEFTNSGHVDLVVTEVPSVSNNNGSVQVFLGNGNGTFNQAPQSPYQVGNTPSFVATGDFNSDGILDLAVANSGAPSSATNGTAVTGNSVSILLGNANPTETTVGNGTFGVPTSFPAGNGPSSIAVADYDQDGNADLAVADQTDNAVTVLLNEGNNLFTALTELPVGDAPVSIVSADFNGDGRPDSATADNAAAEATVILNSTNLFGSGLSSFGTPFPGVQYLDVGLKVKATPRIHPNNDVTLKLAFEISSVTSESFNSIPVISNESVEQTVRLRNNQTAILAGFRQAQLTNGIVGNPGISSVPVAGRFDQNQNTQVNDTELLIMVTPRIVRLAPRKDHIIYAGQGSPEGTTGAGLTPLPGAPPRGALPPQAQPPVQEPQQQPPAQPPQQQPPNPGVATPEEELPPRD
jgi:hypothetical protein